MSILFLSLPAVLLTKQAAAIGSAGCGLGSVVFSDNAWWKQILAVTTNGTSGSQTFGITSGTSNCAPGLFGQVQQQQDFVAANLTSLQREGAEGEGESLNGLATVLGCRASDYASFGAFTQRHYSDVFNSKIPNQVLSNIKTTLQQDSVLAEDCSLSRI